MTGAIVWILIDALMVYLNYKYAIREEENGGKFFKHLFTIFTAFWVLCFGFDVFGLIKVIIGG